MIFSRQLHAWIEDAGTQDGPNAWIGRGNIETELEESWGAKEASCKLQRRFLGAPARPYRPHEAICTKIYYKKKHLKKQNYIL